MRIVNILPHPQHYSYAGTSAGGRTLKPGEFSQVLPFDRLILPDLWRDIRNRRIQFTLDKGDREFLADIVREGQREVPPVVVRAPPKPKKVIKAAQAKLTPKKDPPKPPRLADAAITPEYVPARIPTTVEEARKGVQAGYLSLKDLNQPGVPHTPTQKSTKEDIQAFMGGQLGGIHGRK
jgi:hypothetical protein